MSKNRRRDLPPDEQHVLEHGHIQLLTSPEDITGCDQAIIKHHDLHDATLVGEQLRYAFVYKGQWLALATWSSAAFHIKDRDQFIGWTPDQCCRRRRLLANNSRLLPLPDCHYPNLISCFMKLMLQRLTEAGGGMLRDKEKAFLADIIDRLNDLFGRETTDQDQLSYVRVIHSKMLESKILSQQAANNTKEQFATSPDLDSALMNAVVDALDAHTAMSTQAINKDEVRRGIKDILLNYSNLWEALRARPAA